MSGDISSLLVANRGEIAVRIMRTARAMGLRTIAVFSDADRDAPHVRAADIAVRIGPAALNESYLSIPAILSAARASGATAVHPGYGFLSENAGFARSVADAGLTFVGPPAQAIEDMGDKARAKRRMIEAGVPCVPGYEGTSQSDKALAAAARDIGFPIMVKASAGGGGRGMRLVARNEELGPALKQARSEAQNAFGNGDLILERAIARPRHVEVQVFADRYGNTIHLGERDCSVQRRHQKVIEEAPCPVMTPDLRDRMGAAAVTAARAVGYVGAGTVEFLLDQDGQFYFLEMNTRLQVEHPVTEMVTGIDLVAWQLRIARGERLPLRQQDVVMNGHAIEARLYAEAPEAGFLPSSGPVLLCHMPPDVRVDTGVVTGGEVSPFYDPMIAKVIVHGATREDARLRLTAALARAAVFGPSTNRDFLIDALQRSGFTSGEATTAFIGETYGDRFDPGAPEDALYAAAAVIQYAAAQAKYRSAALDVSFELLDWSSTGQLQSVFEYEAGQARTGYLVRPTGGRTYEVMTKARLHRVSILSITAHEARLKIDDAFMDLIWREDAPGLWLATASRTVELCNLAGMMRRKSSEAGDGALLAPMHGKLLEICVAEGDRVRRGEKVAVLEAMKMQHELSAGIDGRVSRIAASEGAQLGARTLILEIEPLEAEPS